MSHVDQELLLAEACDWTSPEEHLRVATHLEECPGCLDRFAGFCAERTILEAAAHSWRTGRPRFLIAAAVALFALVLGAILWKSGRSERHPELGAAPPSPRANEGLSPTAQGEKDDAYTSLGFLYPSREVSIVSKVQAHVERVEVARGSRVRKGDLLIQLKAPELEALAAEARARLAQGETELRKVETVVSKGLATSQELDAAKSRVIIDKARLDTCEANLSFLRIVAPFDGIITDRAVEEGSLVGPPVGSASSPLLQLRNIDRLRLTVSIPVSSESSLDRVARGDPVSFVLRDRRDRKMSGVYLGSTRTVDPNTGMFSVDIEVDNSSLGLLPGMLVLVAWPPSK